ncbi:hypothetical protein [Leptothoe spongobia]|uniref:DUF8166 domain-containing protein n=1 Tax=Leptothoe spongobia TAU-MAC 1115 TaxID=1967444 RepID=A0A947DHT6_9CYAN|nr:hypothetical protein [Leptothoe spongobia]MBT9316954.1 hypothetical protein [Leptothoe spongobia TAU-MAC 1115]
MVSVNQLHRGCKLGTVVKSNSHCDYVVQLNTDKDVIEPPVASDYGFGQFVSLETDQKHWAVGIIYNSQLFNPAFLNSGPQLTSTPDPLFTPDLIQETKTLLNVVLVGSLSRQDKGTYYGQHGIPRNVVPVSTPVYCMDAKSRHQFHLSADKRPQFRYYGHLLNCGGAFANQLTQQILTELSTSGLFDGEEQRALQVLCKELTWKNTLGAMR